MSVPQTDDSQTAIPPDAPRGTENRPPLVEARRKTWEIELIISGAVIFALISVPSWLDRVFDQVSIHLSRELFIFPYLAYYMLTLATYILIVCFVLHLVGRAYWVGLVGLHAVFPQGIDWEKVSFGPLAKEFYRRALPSLPDLIRRVDRFCSSIFSVAFYLILYMSYGGLVMAFASPLAWAVDELFFAGNHFLAVLLAIFAAFLLPSLILVGLDKLSEKSLFSWLGRSAWFRAVCKKLMPLYYLTSPVPLGGPIQFTLFTNLPKKVVYPALYAAMFGLAAVFVAASAARSGSLRFHSYLYLPEETMEMGVEPKYYESLRKPEEIYRITPSIPSDIVTEPYVKLFIPYSPLHHNEDLEQRACPDLKPLRQEGIALVDRDRLPEKRAVADSLRCLAKLYEVRLDARSLENPEFHFYRHPHSGVRGIVTYIDVEDLERGRHLLKLERQYHDEELPESRRFYSIPFWI